MLAEDIAKLMTLIPMEETKARQEGTDRIEGGAFDGVLDKATPFMFKGGEGINAGVGEQEWVVDKERYKYDEKFDALSPVDGKITGAGKITYFLYGNAVEKWVFRQVEQDFSSFSCQFFSIFDDFL